MDMSSVIAYIAAVMVAAAVGLFVFLLFPARSVEPAQVDEAESAVRGVAQDRAMFTESLAAAAPKGYVGWLQNQIVYAGRPAGWSVARILTWKLILAVGAAAFGLLFVFNGGPQPFKVVLAIASVVLLFFAPDILINSRAQERQHAILLALPDTLDQMTIAVEAGLGFDSAMAKAARGGEGPLPEELIRVLQDMSIGRTRRESFEELTRRTSSDDLRRFARAIIQADAYGLAIGEVLRVQAGEMRTKRRQRAEEQAQKITVKIIFPLVFCLLPAMFIVILTPAVIGIFDQFAR
ncbi:MAG TPA: type II secretion system F family protein [Agromyces sp.]